ncbi:MAG TPA: glycosyltransferase family 4 protein [Candidatus Udaeobacter sp.]|nr:glycosyltransferase family 4 protein [Candidatus Udaeobacter sp.]
MIAPTPFFADRGCHVRILEEGRILTRRGHQVLVATYHHGRDMDGVRTVRTPRIPWYQELAPGPSPHKLYVDCLLIATSLRAAARFRPHVIHAHLHEGVFVGQFVRRATGAPLVADFQGSLAGEIADHTRGGVLKRIARSVFTPIEHWLTQVPDRIVSSSSRFAESLADHRPRGGIALLADAVDTERFRPGLGSEALRRQLGIPEGRQVVVFLGVLTPYQGIDHLLEAVPQVLAARRETHFLIMGYPNVEAYAARARELGIADHVTFTGRVDYDRAQEFLRLGEVAVSGKLSSTEANGKLYNYMACGLATVVFDTPVNREILGEIGVYARLGDAAALAARIVDLLGAPEERAARGHALRERAVKDYSWDRSGAQMETIYRDLLSGR